MNRWLSLAMVLANAVMLAAADDPPEKVFVLTD